MKNPEKNTSTFCNAVSHCRDIADSLCPGLSALAGNSEYIKVANTRLIDGSVDIDSALRRRCPNESRWDYVFGYRGDAYFVEIHPADTKNVDEMIKKVKWLNFWLDSSAKEIRNIHKCGVFHWIPSGRVKILRTSRQYKKIAASNLLMTNTLSLF